MFRQTSNESAPATASPNMIVLGRLIVVFLALAMAAPSTAGEKDKPIDPAGQVLKVETDADKLLEKWGIKFNSLRISAAGFMLDFRFKVLDEKKAAPLFSRKISAWLIHKRTGARLGVPNTVKVGPMRTTDPPKRDRIYFMLFGNAGKLVASGDVVTIEVGEFMLEIVVG